MKFRKNKLRAISLKFFLKCLTNVSNEWVTIISRGKAIFFWFRRIKFHKSGQNLPRWRENWNGLRFMFKCEKLVMVKMIFSFLHIFSIIYINLLAGSHPGEGKGSIIDFFYYLLQLETCWYINFIKYRSIKMVTILEKIII